jgi:hypothetical protein
MAIKKRCGFCHKVLRPDGTCGYEKCPRYVPDPEPEPTPETPSEGTTTPSEGNTTPTVETPSTGEPAQSDGNTETEPTP